MIQAHDGGVYILDWSDIGECHENDGIHRTSGRIFKVVYGKPQTVSYDLRKAMTKDLCVFLSQNENAWLFRKALRRCYEKAVEDLETCEEVYWIYRQLNQFSDTQDFGVKSLWVENAARSKGLLNRALDIDDEHVRAWAVRLIADRRLLFPESETSSLMPFANDKSGLVRLYAASALNRVSAKAAFQMASKLCSFESDADDRMQPHLIWYRIEPHVVAHWQSAIELARMSRLPLVRQNIVRRLVSEIDSLPEAADAITNGLLDGSLEPDSTLRGIKLALDGWVSATAPGNWDQVAKKLSDQPTLKEPLTQIGIVFGDGRAAEELRRLATSNKTDVVARRRAIAAWARTKPDDLEPKLIDMIRDKSITNAVVEAMVNCESPKVAKTITGRYRDMNPEGKRAAINTLVSRKTWSHDLLWAIENNRIPKEAMTAYHANRIYSFEDQRLRQRLLKTWGKIKSTSAEKEKQIKLLTKQLMPDGKSFVAHDLKSGQEVFKNNCAACHVLFGTGGNTGPDLTGANRNNLNYLLSNIVSPSSSVAENYRASNILLEDGRLISGLILQKGDKTIQVQTTDEVIKIARQEIEEINETDLSVMPEGLLTNLSDQQIADLIGYLRQ